MALPNHTPTAVPANSAGAALRVIGIAGASGSGKSYLAQNVAAALDAPVLSLDAYYRDLSHLPLTERARQNFDHPYALDWPLLLDNLHTLAREHQTAVPTYDFSTHTRNQETHHMEAEQFLVLEGILALHNADVRALLTLKVFVELGAEDCLQRRIERDVRERGRTVESVLEQYRSTVLPMYEEFVQPTASHAELLVRGDAPIAASTEAVLRALGVRLPANAGLAYSGL